MSEAELIEAMRPGTRSPSEARVEGDLGRFGLGLKTASFSQCRCLTVISRKDGRTSAAVWDLDTVVETNEWTLGILETATELKNSRLLGQTGTVVVWDKLDRLAGEGGEINERELDRSSAAVADYLALVFHRFLLGRASGSRSRIELFLNGAAIPPFDPFFTERAFQEPEDVFRYGDSRMKVRTYTLPHFSAVPKEDWERYAGQEGYLKNQGFYVFRGDRLIVYGTWFGLMRQGELTKLTRVALDLPTTLDATWKVDVKKASAQPPPEVRRYLRGLLERMNVTGRKVFRHKGAQATSNERLPVWRRIVTGEDVMYRVDLDHPAIAHLLEQCPTEALRGQVEAVLELVAGGLPLAALYNDVASSPESTLPANLSENALVASATAMAIQLYRKFSNRQRVIAMIRAAEPFSLSWDELEPVVLKVLDSVEEH